MYIWACYLTRAQFSHLLGVKTVKKKVFLRERFSKSALLPLQVKTFGFFYLVT